VCAFQIIPCVRGASGMSSAILFYERLRVWRGGRAAVSRKPISGNYIEVLFTVLVEGVERVAELDGVIRLDSSVRCRPWNSLPCKVWLILASCWPGRELGQRADASGTR